jgi:hypothetical protein
MSIIQVRVIGTGLLYLLIFLSGIWLSRSGAPYSTMLVTIHKLITLAAMIFFGRIIYQIHKGAPLSTIEWTIVVVMGVLFIGTIITGGLLSTNKPMPAIVLTMHKITPLLTVLSNGIMLYVLLSRKS